MISFAEVKIKQLQIHKVGNKYRGEDLILSDNSISIENDNDLITALYRYFFSNFNSEVLFRFNHESDLNLNEVYAFSKNIFNDENNFDNLSKQIAKHLYKSSLHPNIIEGNFFVALFDKVIYQNNFYSAIGIFKSETIDTYLKVNNQKKFFDIKTDKGTNINKLDKGCLILNLCQDNGFVISIIDNTNKGSEAQYWKDQFLGVKNLNNEFHQTNQFLGIAKNFVTKQLDEEFEVSKADKIDLLNRSVEYFKTHETFDKKEFEQEVFQDSGIIKSFRNFDNNYRQENEIEITDSFDISPQAVKKQARVFKSVLKLDKNFHIYIHGNRDMIEQGVDKDGRKYYKIYYDQES
jgi:hypothetical protein